MFFHRRFAFCSEEEGVADDSADLTVLAINLYEVPVWVSKIYATTSLFLPFSCYSEMITLQLFDALLYLSASSHFESLQ
jgi:hypothetical protein